MASQPVLSLDSFVSLSHVWFTALISYSDIKCKIVFSFPFSFLLSGVQKSVFFFTMEMQSHLVKSNINNNNFDEELASRCESTMAHLLKSE